MAKVLTAKGIKEANRDGKLNKIGFIASLIKKGKEEGGCRWTQYKNAYERFEYDEKSDIEALQERINKALTSHGLNPLLQISGEFDQETRTAIKQLKEEEKITTKLEEFTPDLEDKIDKINE